MRFCSICSGSSGNCIYIGSENTSVLVDVGISGIRVERGLNEIEMTTKDVDGILVTHEHSDHVKGLGVLARRYGIPIYGTEGTLAEIRKSTSIGKIPKGLLRTVKADEEFEIGDLSILPFEISHDAAEPVGYRVEHEGKKAAVATDMGCYSDYTVEHLKGLDVLLLESNHDVHMLQVGRYPYYLKMRILSEHGHLSNETSGQLLGKLLHDGVRHVFLGHLSQENNYEELAYQTVCNEVSYGDNPFKSDDFDITIAHRDRVSEAVNW
ncbi:MAG: MBL fold metallo-hydrolase [Lachnospiraceae bacterium]|nr:MBL fold metallo-hydrolase [Lachnospiraceae bacterium]